MTPKHITIVYPITGPDHEEQLLAAGRWIASCHGDAMAERDALQGELERVKADLAAMTQGYEVARLEIGSLKKSLAQADEQSNPDHEALLSAAQAYIVASNRMDAAMQDGFNFHGAMSGIIGATDNLHAAIAANKKG